MEQQQCQQWFCGCWLVAGWESGLAALFLSDCCVGTLCCPLKLCMIEMWEDKAVFSPYPLLPDHVQALLARVSQLWFFSVLYCDQTLVG